MRHCFIVAQIALAFVLLTGAGLLGLSLKRAMAVSPGFHADHVLTGQISLAGNKYPAASAGLTFIDRLMDELSINQEFWPPAWSLMCHLAAETAKAPPRSKAAFYRPGNHLAATILTALEETTFALWASP